MKINSVLSQKDGKHIFDAFNLENEDFERKVVKVDLNKFDCLSLMGRVAIKNRIKPFSVTISKSEALYTTNI